MRTEQNYKYYAFISYNGNDERWAKWLHKKLEYYKIPSALRKQHIGLPKQVRPIFWYKQDLSGTKLTSSLHKELEASKYLIVICSPNSAQSEWVNDEVQDFINQGKEDRIIPFIVEGIPYSNDSSECFPPALRQMQRQEQLRGININEQGGDRALVDVIATMFGLRFDDLWGRHRRRVIRHRIYMGIACLIALLVGIFYWDYTRPTYEYFADYVDCNGVPKGILPLNKEQIEKRRRLYRFEKRRIPFGEPGSWQWRLAKVAFVNSAGTVQEDTVSEKRKRYSIQEIEYSKISGAVIRINYCNRNGKIVLRHDLSERNGIPASLADFKVEQEEKGSGFINANTTYILSDNSLGTQKANITRYAYKRNEQGYIIECTYHSNNDADLSRSAVSDADGIFGMRYTLDSLGRQVKIEYLGIDDEPCSTKQGVAGKLYEYDCYGNICKATYINIKGEPILNQLMWAQCISIADNSGNIIEESCFGIDGKPCLDKDGAAKYTLKYDERGNYIEKACFGTDEKPCLNKYGVAKATLKYDERGNNIEQACFGTDGKPCLSKYGVAKYTLKYDERGNRIEQACFGTDGKPCLDKNGVAKYTEKYDERGNSIETAYFGTDGKPCLDKYGVAKYTFKYDERGNRIEQSYYGTDGKPCLDKNGVAKYTNKYDERGNNIEQACFGTDGKPCLNKYGVAKATLKYDERGNRIEAAFFGTDGKPCLHKKGVAKVTDKYDERGNSIEQSYYGTDGKPCLDKNGVAKATWKYDERGNRIEIAFFGTDGKPCLDKDGVAKATFKYDERGNIIEIAFFGTDGKPCLHKDGVAKFTLKYDERGNTIKVTYYDEKGNIIQQ